MSLYETGTITSALNSTTISGTGTKWSDAKIGITNGSVLFVSSSAGMDGVYQVKRVINDTSIELTQPIYKAFTNAKYSILVAEASSTASFANQLAAALGYYQAQIDGWQQIMTGTGDVELTAPDGTKVTIKSFTELSNGLDEKVNKKDLGSAAYQNAKVEEQTPADGLLSVGQYGIGGRTAVGNLLINSFGSINRTGIYAAGGVSSVGFYEQYQSVLFMSRAAGASLSALQIGQRGIATNCYPTAAVGWRGWKECWGEGNTTIDSNGFIKKASPIIKIFHDGSFETNDESAGASVKREGVGIYRISNILGMNSDGTWGGIDGGFEVPTDRNGQRLLWLDYEVEADGSIIVKTYHRTYPDAPEFARNIKDGYEESDPIDIPSDQFLSVRVEMPQDSIWNQAQKAAQEEMAREEIAEE